MSGVRRRARPAQSTVVGAMFFIVLVFFSLGILYYVENNYVLYGEATQRAWQLQQQRNDQRFTVGEAYVLPAKGGYKTLFFVRNEGGTPIDIVNAYLCSVNGGKVSRYPLNLYLNPGQSVQVNLTDYNPSFPSVLNGDYNVSLWTSLGVGASTIVVATAPGVGSSPEGNVYPVAGSLYAPGSNALVGTSSSVHEKAKHLAAGFAAVNLTVRFSVVNNNPYPIKLYTNSSFLLYWVPTPQQLLQLAVNAAGYHSAFYGGVIGAALPLNAAAVINGASVVNGAAVINEGSVVTVTIPNYTVMFYNFTKLVGVSNSGKTQIGSIQTVFQSYPADIYVPIYPSTPTSYTFVSKVLLSYSVPGESKAYNIYFNNGYFEATVSVQ